LHIFYHGILHIAHIIPWHSAYCTYSTMAFCILHIFYHGILHS